MEQKKNSLENSPEISRIALLSGAACSRVSKCHEGAVWFYFSAMLSSTCLPFQASSHAKTAEHPPRFKFSRKIDPFLLNDKKQTPRLGCHWLRDDHVSISKPITEAKRVECTDWLILGIACLAPFKSHGQRMGGNLGCWGHKLGDKIVSCIKTSIHHTTKKQPVSEVTAEQAARVLPAPILVPQCEESQNFVCCFYSS
jgi:hypothetical protein